MDTVNSEEHCIYHCGLKNNNKVSSTSKLKTQRKKKRMKMVEELWDNYKRCNISIMGIPEEEERKEQMQRIYSK